MSYMFSLTFFFFFTAAHFHFALVAASISHFFTASTKVSCCSSKEKMYPLFLSSRSRSLSPLSFAGLSPTFSFSLSVSCSIFQICGHGNVSKLNNLDNTDTETISAFRFRLHWLFVSATQDAGARDYAISLQNDELHLGCIPVDWVILHWYACGADGRSGGRAVGVRSRDYQIFSDG